MSCRSGGTVGTQSLQIRARITLRGWTRAEASISFAQAKRASDEELDLASGANRTPEHVALLYATDDDQAAAVAEWLISAAGFDPVKAGGVSGPAPSAGRGE